MRNRVMLDDEPRVPQRCKVDNKSEIFEAGGSSAEWSDVTWIGTSRL